MTSQLRQTFQCCKQERMAFSGALQAPRMPRTACRPVAALRHTCKPLSITGRKAYSGHAKVSRGALQVVAFKEEKHRAEVINDLGREFVDVWLHGMAKGIDDDISHRMHNLLDFEVSFRNCLITDSFCAKGRGAVMDMLRGEHSRLVYNLQDWKQILWATNLDQDSFFSLVQLRYHATPPRNVASTDPNETSHEYFGYQLFELDVMYDDTVRRISRVEQRGQLTAQEMAKMCPPGTDGRSRWLPTPFPVEHMMDAPKNWDVDKMRLATRDWCRARSSGESKDILDPLLAPDFRLWDAYGVLPLLCDPTRRSKSDTCVVQREQVKELIHQVKDSYDIECHRIDAAVSSTHTAGFTQWMSHITNKNTKERFDLEALEVDLFTPEGKLRDVWLFRDPMDFEKEMLRESADNKTRGEMSDEP